MPRLLRPPIPLDVKCKVALRQLGEMWPGDVLAEHKRGLGRLLRTLLAQLSDLLGCEPADLRLDHNPALAIREKVFRRGVHVDYVPPANDPEWLIYRDKHAHDIKTRVRGDGAQFSDLALIRRQKKRQRKASPSRGRKSIKPVDFLKKAPKRKIKGKSNWPKRSFPKRRT